MVNRFLRKLETFTPLSDDQRRALAGFTDRVQNLGARDTIIEDGEDPDLVNIVLSGWACRCKILPDGRRQIIAVLLPGDMCDPSVFLLERSRLRRIRSSSKSRAVLSAWMRISEPEKAETAPVHRRIQKVHLLNAPSRCIASISVGRLVQTDESSVWVGPRAAQSHALGTLTPVTLASVSAQAIRDITANGPELVEALWWQMLEAAEIECEWTISLGRRTAVERLAHLFCGVSVRLSALGVMDGSECDMPITQGDLAEATGLSAVPVNRSLQEMRASGLVELRRKRLTISNWQGLMDLPMFDPAYLHRRPAWSGFAPNHASLSLAHR